MKQGTSRPARGHGCCDLRPLHSAAAEHSSYPEAHYGLIRPTAVTGVNHELGHHRYWASGRPSCVSLVRRDAGNPHTYTSSSEQICLPSVQHRKLPHPKAHTTTKTTAVASNLTSRIKTPRETTAMTGNAKKLSCLPQSHYCQLSK